MSSSSRFSPVLVRVRREILRILSEDTNLKGMFYSNCPNGRRFAQLSVLYRLSSNECPDIREFAEINLKWYTEE